MNLDAVGMCPHVPENMDHILPFSVGHLDARSTRNIGSES